MIALLPVTREIAQAALAGTPLPGLGTAPDWPHPDTADALRPVAEHPSGAGGTFLVLEDGLVVGDCGWFGPPDDDGEVEIGYGLARSARGRGVGRAAVALLLDWVAAQGATRVRAEVQPGNAASVRLLEALGFRPEGLERGMLVLLR